ncbi:NAD-dependent epimerase/dehydratase family protein [Streptomyces purpureus]|uniref:NAD-dependent epimerase n=1 Tax=Streptomyces purpureus TaxID=1951 RepID=A0A918H0L1_9ACTN|nr:NAD-dependent epimerase/dehydratase family protein [Streptomyces purpureus]GGT29716.1 NAD-dependent epimerase [Streptomyces purpureus]
MNSDSGLRVVVIGATGNVGTSVVRALAAEPRVDSVVGLARRRPSLELPKTRWEEVDLSKNEDAGTLLTCIRGADAVVHLAWRFQPTHNPGTTWRTNVLGSMRVFEAVAAAGVPSLVYASSVGAYSPGPKTGPGVDETWPTHGWPGAAYCREKAYLERVLDTYERDHPKVRVVRMRPAFLFKEQSASEQRRIFAGRFFPGPLLRPGLLPFVPDIEGLRFQALHTDDAAQAYRLAVIGDARGPFNLAADPVIDAQRLSELLDARIVKLPRRAAHGAIAAAWHLRVAPASPDLFDAVLRLPLMSAERAGRELGWRPTESGLDAVTAFLRGVREGSGDLTRPLAGRRIG